MRAAEVRKYKTQAARAYGAAEVAGLKARTIDQAAGVSVAAIFGSTSWISCMSAPMSLKRPPAASKPTSAQRMRTHESSRG